MNSALKPLTSSSQSPSNASQGSKPMHPQGAAPTYGQPSHLPQGMANLHPNTNLAHNHPSTQHYLNVPNASGHYMGQIQPSNHPVANPSGGTVGSMYNPSKSAPYMSGYQPGHMHPINQSTLPPVSQSLPPSNTVHSGTSSLTKPSPATTTTPDVSSDRPQSNGTQENKQQQPQQKAEPSTNVSPNKEKSIQNVAAQLAQTQASTEPPLIPTEKPSPEDPIQSTTTTTAVEPLKQEVTKPPDTPDSNVQTPPTSSNNSESNSSSPVTTNNQTEKAPTPVEETDKSSSTMSTTAASEAKTATVDENKTSENEDKVIPQVESSENSNASSTGEKSESNSKEASTDDKTDDKEPTDTAPEQSSPVKPKDTSPVKQTTPKTPTRKSRTPKPEESSASNSSSSSSSNNKAAPSKDNTKPQVQNKSPTAGGKAKRQRTKTQPYQSPLPEIEIITKITASTPRRSKGVDDKLIVFYKNEFLAVRNAEGGFYLCQAVQNIYKSSTKIKIRWLSQDKVDKTGEVYTPDFYDLTDFDCILTNLSLSRIDKGKYRLPTAEKERTESILKRSLAVEKGEEVSSPSLTAEHPDGLDLSLYKDEEQLMKKRRTNRKRGRKPSKSPVKRQAPAPAKKAPETPKSRRVGSPPKKSPAPTKKPVTLSTRRSLPVAPPPPPPQPKKAAPSSSASRASRSGVKRKAEPAPKTSPVVDQNKARMLAKIGRKVASKPPPKPVVVEKPSKKAPAKSTKAATPAVKKAASKAAPAPAKPVTTRSGKRLSRK